MPHRTQAVTFPHRLVRSSPLAIALAMALTACGSGGDADQPAVAPPGPPALSGTAATGMAIAGGRVEARCNGGTGTATTKADGSYTMALTSGTLPCVLRVTAEDGTVLHSLAVGDGSKSKANLTPVSELVLAQLTASAPARYFEDFGAQAAAKLTGPQAEAAVASVVATLQAAGIDLTSTGNVLTADLVASQGSTTGNAHDQALDALLKKLEDQLLTLAQLTDAVALGSPSAPTSALSIKPSLPAGLLLQPAAPNCSALRSGTYRVVVNTNRAADDEGDNTELVTFDAPALKVTNADGSVDVLRELGPCRFQTPDGSEAAVSAAGIMVLQIKVGASVHLALAFPEQKHAVSALAGEWNSLQLDRTSDKGPVILTNATWTVDKTGRLGAATYCENGTAECYTGTAASSPDFPDISGALNAQGGFVWTNRTDDWSERVFLYRSGGGELLRVGMSPAGGHLSLWTRKAAGQLPAKNVTRSFWNITQNNNYTTGNFSESSSTVRTVNADANSYLRDAVINSSTGVTRPETLRLSQPRVGYTQRVAETATASDGSSSPVSDFLALGLRGTGLSAVGFPASNALVISVAK